MHIVPRQLTPHTLKSSVGINVTMITVTTCPELTVLRMRMLEADALPGIIRNALKLLKMSCSY